MTERRIREVVPGETASPAMARLARVKRDGRSVHLTLTNGTSFTHEAANAGLARQLVECIENWRGYRPELDAQALVVRASADVMPRLYTQSRRRFGSSFRWLTMLKEGA